MKDDKNEEQQQPADYNPNSEDTVEDHQDTIIAEPLPGEDHQEAEAEPLPPFSDEPRKQTTKKKSKFKSTHCKYLHKTLKKKEKIAQNIYSTKKRFIYSTQKKQK